MACEKACRCLLVPLKQSYLSKMQVFFLFKSSLEALRLPSLTAECVFRALWEKALGSSKAILPEKWHRLFLSSFLPSNDAEKAIGWSSLAAVKGLALMVSVGFFSPVKELFLPPSAYFFFPGEDEFIGTACLPSTYLQFMCYILHKVKLGKRKTHPAVLQS